MLHHELIEYLNKNLVDFKIKSSIAKVINTLYYLSRRDPIEAIKREEFKFTHPNSFRVIRKLQQEDELMFIFTLQNYCVQRLINSFKSGEVLATESKTYHSFAESVSKFIKHNIDLDYEIINRTIENFHKNINSIYDDEVRCISQNTLLKSLYIDIINFVAIPNNIVNMKSMMDKLFNTKEYYQ